MKITLEHVPDMTFDKQQEVSMALRITLAHHKVEIQGVTVRFDTDQ